MHLKKIFAVSALVALLAVPMVSFAATFKAAENYTLRNTETVDGNFYSAGGTVMIDGTVNGDVVAGGGKVYINGTVRDDVLIGGGDVDLGGTVNGDVRIAGGNVTLRGDVKGEVTIAGGNVIFISTSKSEKDVMVVGGQVTTAGEIMGDLKVRGGQVVINGHIAKSADVRVTKKVTIANGAVIDGMLSYKAPQEATKEQGAVVKGETKFEKTDQKGGQARNEGVRKGVLAFLGIWFLIKLVSIIIAGILLVSYAQSYVQRMVDDVFAKFGKETLRGFIFLIATPIAAIVLCITLIGIIPGALLAIFYLYMVAMAKITAGIVLGAGIERLFNKTGEHNVTWKTVVGGNVVLAVLAFIPIIGWLIILVSFAATLGAWAALWYSQFKKGV